MANPSSTPSSDEHLIDDLDAALDREGADPIRVLLGLLEERKTRQHAARAARLVHSKVAEFALVELIGIGGMGATYRGTDPAGTNVAIKVVGPLSDEQRDRFRKECRILSRLRHPGIVSYRDHGTTDDGLGFLVMDLIDGESLQDAFDRIDSTPWGPTLSGGAGDGGGIHSDPVYQRRILQVLAKVAEALDYAHESGVVHRDLKPANVLLTAELEPVLIDFGLSLTCSMTIRSPEPGRSWARSLTWLPNSSPLMGANRIAGPICSHWDSSSTGHWSAESCGRTSQK